MKSKALGILNSFIKSPDLRTFSPKYPFVAFDFKEEEIPENDFHIPENTVLGKQAEACFETYLKRSLNYELLGANLQIHTSTELNDRKGKETLGELDYIVRNLKTNEVVHIELACKFYLYDVAAGISEEEKWVGPNRKDGLIDKLEKLKWKQFPLITNKEAIQNLKELHIDFPTSQKLCLKSFLFIPKHTEINLFTKNFRDCIVGRWIRFHDFQYEDVNAQYAIPQKQEWLLPFDSIKTWYLFSEIGLKIENQIHHRKSPLIYKKTSNKIEPFFIVWW